MNEALLTSVAATGFTVAFFHAAIPTHWIPFVLVARARGWSRGRALAVTAFAGLGHVLVTSLLGLLVALLGFKLGEQLQEVFPWVVGGILAAIGVYYLWRQLRGSGVCHHHPPGGAHQPTEHCGHEHEHEHTHWDAELEESPLLARNSGDWAAIGGLFMMLTLSPCESFLGIYLSGVQFGWSGFLVLSGILAVGALAAMLLFTFLALIGFEKLPLRRVERFEAGMLGVLFLVLGVVAMFVRHDHGDGHDHDHDHDHDHSSAPAVLIAPATLEG